MIDDLDTDEPTMTVTRTIPVPTSVSPEARSALAAGARAGGDSGEPSPAPDDVEGWRAHVRSIDAMLLATFGAQAAQLPGTVEAITVGAVPVFDITPEGVPDGSERICLDFHGGALILGGGECCRAMGIHAAARVGVRTWTVDYGMPPDHPYPAALDDCLAVYRELLKSWAPDRIVVSGGSAGGNLAAAMILRARDEELPLPGALVLLSPEVDLTESGDSFHTNLGVDTVLTRSLADQNALYASGRDLTDPYVSPLFGDLAPPFPPTFLQTGTRDLFLSNTVRMHRKLRASGVEADLHVFEAMPHGGFFGAPEDRELAEEVRRFIDRHVAN